MNRKIRIILSVCIILPVLVAFYPQDQGKVYLIDFNDIVHGISADFVIDAIEKANENEAELIIISMQTPGGMVSSMEMMIQKILASEVPVVGFVNPSGAKAASAGFYLLMACDVAVMAPGTRTGAATPIMMGGGGDSEDENFKTLMEKIKGDSRAFLRTLVRGHLRNPEVPMDFTVQKAVETIDKSDAYTENEALEYGLIDFTAQSINAILEKLDGKEIRRFTLEGQEPTYTLANTKNAVVEKVEMDFRQKFLSYLSNPMIAMILGALGIFGLYIEFNNPGMIFPGAIGVISLIMAAISFQILTVNYAGLILILIAVVLFIMEFSISSYGLLTVGGIICLVIGGIMLFDGPIPELRLNLWQMIPFALSFAAISLFLLRLVIKAHLGKIATGSKGLMGEKGFVKNGKAYGHGEIWSIVNSGDFAEGDKIEVTEMKGLGMIVKKVKT